jgi:hypothetical protein
MGGRFRLVHEGARRIDQTFGSTSISDEIAMV